MNVRVRIIQHTYTTAIVEYKNKEYTVAVSDLQNVNAGWTYGWINKSKLR